MPNLQDLKTSIRRDVSGNIREIQQDKPLAIGGNANFASTVVAAGAAQVTVAAATGFNWVVDAADICIASIASSTTVNVTLTDGTNTLGQWAFSASGKFTLVDEALAKISYAGASGKLVALTAGSAGTGSTTTLNLKAHKVTAADV